MMLTGFTIKACHLSDDSVSCIWATAVLLLITLKSNSYYFRRPLYDSANLVSLKLKSSSIQFLWVSLGLFKRVKDVRPREIWIKSRIMCKPEKKKLLRWQSDICSNFTRNALWRFVSYEFKCALV